MLTEKQPKLVIASEETEKMVAIITVDKKEAEETQIIVNSEEAEATK
jgi:dynein heavy chain